MSHVFAKDAFAGKVALVTGATVGIGRQTALRFAEHGAAVMLSGRNEERGQEVLNAIAKAGGVAAFLAGNVADSKFCDRLVAETVERFGRLDILFNNAGIALVGKIDKFSDAEWQRIFDVNVHGVFYMARAAVRQMKKQGGGVIVNMASISGLVAQEDSAAYSATKGAIAMFTKVLAMDHAKDNIRVNAICPGDIDTGMQDAFYRPLGLSPEELRKEVGKFTPMGRLGTADEIALPVLYLASDAAAFMTGALHLVDGGFVAR